MTRANRDEQKCLVATSSANPTYLSSRRNFVAGAAFLGALIASNTLGAGNALARRRRRHRRRRGGVHCFVKGTMIMTPEGERCIKKLKIGDLVQTVSGEAKPVKWIGRLKTEKRANHSWNSAHIPVKVARGALDGSVPHRDLYVTDAHCLFLNGLLIRAIDLINGASIKKQMPSFAEELTFFHVELADHDVIFANGAPTETLSVEAGERQNFDNFDEYLGLYGAEPATISPCAPIAANVTPLQELQSRYRSVIAPICDRRQPLEIIRDELADLATQEAA